MFDDPSRGRNADRISFRADHREGGSDVILRNPDQTPEFPSKRRTRDLRHGQIALRRMRLLATLHRDTAIAETLRLLPNSDWETFRLDRSDLMSFDHWGRKKLEIFIEHTTQPTPII
jgi:hypothetical protein